MHDLLAQKRREIDVLDARLPGLLAERVSLAASFAGLKKKVRDLKREAYVLKRAAGRIKNKTLRPAILAVYRELIKQGLRLQSARLAAAGSVSETRGCRKKK